MNPIEIGVLTLFDMFMVLLLIFGIFRDFRAPIIESIIFIISGSLLTGMSQIISENRITTHFISLILFLVLFCIYLSKNSKFKILTQLSIFAFISTILMVTQIFINIILGVILNGVEYTFTNGLISQSISIFLITIVYKCADIQKLSIYFYKKSNLFKIIMLNFFIIYNFILTFWFDNTRNYLEVSTGILIMVIFTTFINVLFYRESILRNS